MGATGGKRRVGRRGGDADTRSDVLRAARRLFARGYASASIRSIATEAGVDPSLVLQYFGSKDALFLAAMKDAMRPGEEIPPILAEGHHDLGQRLATWFFGLWEDSATRYPIQAMLVSAASHPGAAELLREFVTTEIISRVSAVSPREDARLRAELAGSHLIGAALMRYVYEIPPLSEVPLDEMIQPIGEAIGAYLTTPAPT